MTGFHRMVPRFRRHRCVRCRRRYNGMGGVCPRCTEVSPERIAAMEAKRRATVKRLRRKLDPGCLVEVNL